MEVTITHAFPRDEHVLAIFPVNNILIQEDIPQFANLSD